MYTFLIIIFTLYTLLHVHFFLKLRALIRPGYLCVVGLWLFLCFMILSPVLVRILEKGGYEKPATLVAYTGYTWMAFVFLFFCSSLLTDIGIILCRAVSIGRLGSPEKLEFLLPLFVSGMLVAYGFFEAKNIRTERITIETEKLPTDLSSLRIVQISDLHIGLLTKEEHLKAQMEKVDALKPDILISTGDLVDGQLESIEHLARYFSSLKVPLGKFAITGNHEYYVGMVMAKNFLEKSGFKFLNNEIYRIGNGINLVGIDDASWDDGNELSLLKRVRKEEFTILLKHRPIVSNEATGLFDLQISGHTHGGQILPFRLITRIFFKHISGYKLLDGRSRIYISRGMGTWGPPVRIFCPPEITLIDVVKKKPQN